MDNKTEQDKRIKEHLHILKNSIWGNFDYKQYEQSLNELISKLKIN